MNDIYISLKPIYEHFKHTCASNRHISKYIAEFINEVDGCYCYKVRKIVINTKRILAEHHNINSTIDHEVMHYIIHKFADVDTTHDYDNVAELIEQHIWGDDWK